MIASVFKKSTPLNYALIVFLVLFFFFIYQIQDTSWMSSGVLLLKKGFTFLVILASVFLTSFIGKRNGLTKNSSYTAIFFILLLLFFTCIETADTTKITKSEGINKVMRFHNEQFKYFVG